MPQLDPTWIISQVFWALVCFGLTFLIMKSLILPKITSVMDERENQIEANVKIAKNLKKELEDAIVAYEKSLDGAYQKASEILKQTNKEIADFVKSQEHEFSDKMKKRTDEAKGKIESTKEKILVDVENIATELSSQILFKLTSENIAEDKVRSYISKEIKGA